MTYPIGNNSPGGVPGAVAPNVGYSGTFIPTIWSGKLIEKFYDATVLAAISNTDYEGEIKSHGDKVIIRTKPTLTINNYVADQALVVERPSSSTVELLIDKGKYFNTVLDDVMEIQSDLDQMNMWSDDASEQMKIQIDTDVLANIGPSVDALNKGATAGRISLSINLGTLAAPLQIIERDAAGGETEIIDLIVDMGTVLDEQNIPESGRWLLLPAWMVAMIKKSDLRDASLSGDGASILRNGRVGMVDRFTIYSTNLLPFAAGFPLPGNTNNIFEIYAGHSHGLTFASQMTKMETLRGESIFGTYMRGLQVYGYKVVDGIAIAAAVVQKA